MEWRLRRFGRLSCVDEYVYVTLVLTLVWSSYDGNECHQGLASPWAEEEAARFLAEWLVPDSTA